MSTFDSNKIKSDIADLKNKKSTLLLSLQNDIDEIISKKKASFVNIGERAYTLSRKEKSDNLASLEAVFETIDKHNDDLAAKEQKKLDIAARYDEEIDMLEKLIPLMLAQPEPEPPAPTQAFCSSCGKSYVLGEDLFCMGCGAKL
ncbi:MAG: hypothetical protein FWG65_04910 [Turicibacter sp.]|nr:hypothetical protein [Turicibacter sp.]